MFTEHFNLLALSLLEMWQRLMLFPRLGYRVEVGTLCASRLYQCAHCLTLPHRRMGICAVLMIAMDYVPICLVENQ